MIYLPTTQHLPQVEPPLPPKETLPTMYDLPSEDPEDPGVPDEFHIYQPELLRKTFQPPIYDRDRIFVGSDLNLYYTARQARWYKRPDWFAVLGVDRLYDRTHLRRSYVAWQEGIHPYIAIELLSPSTEKEDLGQTEPNENAPPTKWQVYEQILRVPYYFVFDGATNRSIAFQLEGGGYREQEMSDSRLWIEDLQLGLGLWQGRYEGIDRAWLRWYDDRGDWIPTEAERERREKELAQAKAERLAQRLKEAGIDLDKLA
ncbi:MAG: Uma2 family endonuclease [Cyanobacteriota bacterium]|nr:Uma2 family endonuclease [Cyanobacteriota bacterium]